MNNVSFYRCTAKNGGAIGKLGDDTDYGFPNISIEEGMFEACQAEENGGAIFNCGYTGEDLTFKDSLAFGDGGATYFNTTNGSGFTSGYKTKYLNNTAFGSGGAVFGKNMVFRESEVICTNNQAGYRGGAFCLVADQPSADNYSSGVFTGNSVGKIIDEEINRESKDYESRAGGALYLDSIITSHMQNSTFIGNKVEGNKSLGGAIYIAKNTYDDVSLVLADSLFESNLVNGKNSAGGAIAVAKFESIGIDSESTFIGNQATSDDKLHGKGGAVSYGIGLVKEHEEYTDEFNGDVSIGKIFKNNKAFTGGAIYVKDYRDIIESEDENEFIYFAIDGFTFENNQAAFDSMMDENFSADDILFEFHHGDDYGNRLDELQYTKTDSYPDGLPYGFNNHDINFLVDEEYSIKYEDVNGQPIEVNNQVIADEIVSGVYAGQTVNESVKEIAGYTLKEIKCENKPAKYLADIDARTVEMTLDRTKNSGEEAEIIYVFEKIEKYQVVYNPNGGSDNVPIDSEEYLKDEKVIVKDDIRPTRRGYRFEGWSLSQNGAVIKDFIITEDTTLYAKWRRVNVNPPVNELYDYTVLHVDNDSKEELDQEELTGERNSSVRISSLERNFDGYTYLKASRDDFYLSSNGMSVTLYYELDDKEQIDYQVKYVNEDGVEIEETKKDKGKKNSEISYVDHKKEIKGYEFVSASPETLKLNENGLEMELRYKAVGDEITYKVRHVDVVSKEEIAKTGEYTGIVGTDIDLLTYKEDIDSYTLIVPIETKRILEDKEELVFTLEYKKDSGGVPEIPKDPELPGETPEEVPENIPTPEVIEELPTIDIHPDDIPEGHKVVEDEHGNLVILDENDVPYGVIDLDKDKTPLGKVEISESPLLTMNPLVKMNPQTGEYKVDYRNLIVTGILVASVGLVIFSKKKEAK